ncbi:hypothetical protein [Salmon gill poxvirus]
MSLSDDLVTFINSFKKYDKETSVKIFTEVISDLDLHTDVLNDMISVIQTSDDARQKIVNISSVNEILSNRSREVFGDMTANSKQVIFCKGFHSWHRNPEILANLSLNYLACLDKRRLTDIVESPLKVTKKISVASSTLKNDIGIPTMYNITKVKHCILIVHCLIVALYERSLSDFNSVEVLVDTVINKRKCTEYINKLPEGNFDDLKEIAIRFFHETSSMAMKQAVNFIVQEKTIKCVQSGKQVKRLFDQEKSCRILLFSVIRCESLEELNKIVLPIFNVSAEFYNDIMEEVQKIMYNYGD